MESGTRRSFLVAVAVSVVALVSAACGPHVSFVQTGAPRQQLGPTAQVKVYLTHVARPYHEVGVVEVDSGDLAERVEAAREVARQHGGNGLVFFGTQRVVSTSTSEEEVQTKDADGNEIKVSVPTTSTVCSSLQRFIVIYKRSRSVTGRSARAHLKDTLAR